VPPPDGVGIKVGVAVGAAVAVGDRVGVKVAVGIGVSVRVALGVGILVGVGILQALKNNIVTTNVVITCKSFWRFMVSSFLKRGGIAHG
jgi:hypothetical protein